jgi:predicted alpha/beta superfamily hydrolase
MTTTPNPLSPVSIANSELRSIHSEVVGQDYLIKVRLPEDYASSTATYPVLYLLDGDHAFALATDVVQYLLYGQSIPDMIIVSPAYGSKDSPSEGGANQRSRDLTPFPLSWSDEPPGGARYFQFFQQELIPHVESLYRIDSANRTLYGGSLGLLFVLYSLFQDPTLFKNYIAVDGFHDQLLEQGLCMMFQS